MTSTTQLDPRAELWLHAALGLSTGQRPFPWQRRLLALFVDGTISRALDLPTGLGKTAVMAIWLVARALGASVPRRLIYIVDRRAVVDQATEVAHQLRSWVGAESEVRAALGLESRALPISTLRGQYVDNREWLDDPAGSAIVVGTVDMIGSRLLFEGYGTSRKMRPFMAGLLGCDTLFVIDEAHLVPPFERLIEAVASGDDRFGPVDVAMRSIIKGVRLLSLSATGRNLNKGVFQLEDDDRADDIVNKRLTARKRLLIGAPVKENALAETLASRAWELAEASDAPIRCIVFANSRRDAEKAKLKLEALARQTRGKNAALPMTELLVGGRRVRERSMAACRLASLGFIAGSEARRDADDHAFLFSTSAGEVGVDLDADHMVSDVVAWERMVQRLGRVNRRGEGDAQILVVPSDRESTDVDLVAVVSLLTALPKGGADTRDASPQGLATIRDRSDSEPDIRALVDVASTPEPLRPELVRPLVDAWSMTSLKQHTGRPEVQPWLRGWVDDRPQTSVVWRSHLGKATDLDQKSLTEFIEATPVHLSERLETETDRVVEWLGALAGRGEGRVVAIVLGPAGDRIQNIQLADLAIRGSPRRKRDLRRWLLGNTVIVDASLGGLSPDGLLDEKSIDMSATADDLDRWSDGESDGAAGPAFGVRFRVRIPSESAPSTSAGGNWRERLRTAIDWDVDGNESKWVIVDRWKLDASTEEDRSTSRLQALDEHQSWAARRALALAEAVGLPGPLCEAIELAASLHDEGKRASNWQAAFSAPDDDDVVYAKTPGPLKVRLLGGYRHEFGSLPYVERDARFQALDPPLQDLVLHLVAAHHGFARPVISTDGCDDEPPSLLKARAREVTLRFLRMQRRWGPWRLAYLEALLRSADQQASRDNEQEETQ